MHLWSETDEEPQIEDKYFFMLRRQGYRGCSRYQFLTFCFLMSGMMGPFFVTSSLGLLEYMPVFDCEIDGVWVANCTKAQICGGGHTALVPYKIDYSEHTSLYNWVGPFNLVCAGPLHMGMIGSALLLGWASTVWFIPYFSTKYGRKGIFMISCMLEIGIISMLLYWCSSLL